LRPWTRRSERYLADAAVAHGHEPGSRPALDDYSLDVLPPLDQPDQVVPGAEVSFPGDPAQRRDQLWEDDQAFTARDLSDIDVEYLFADAIFESLRRQGPQRSPAGGVVHRLRGTQTPTVRIRCWFHRLANIRAKVPDEAAAEVLAHVYAVRDAPTLDPARAAADRFENTYGREFPAAVACFADDRDALLAIHRVPVRHRIRVRTTNLAERGFEEERRWTKVIPAS